MTETLTIAAIKEDQHFLCSLELPEYGFGVYLIFKGDDKPQYYVFFKDELLFEGNDFRASSLHNINDLENTVNLCAFLTAREGDVNPDYFKNYTPEQMEWTRSRECEELAGIIRDFEYQDGENDVNAKEYLNSHFTR